MSISQEIASLAAYLPQDKLALLERAIVIVEKNEPDSAANVLKEALLEYETDTEYLLELVDFLERALAKHHRPKLSQTHSFKSDLRISFLFLRRFVEDCEWEAAVVIMDYYPHVFNPSGKTMCGASLKNCRNLIEGEQCGAPFTNPHTFYCLTCGAPRRLCRVPPKGNGRCRHHGGNKVAAGNGRLSSGRLKVYGESLSGRLQEMYVESITDVDYLSVAPEIAALATRNAQLMSEIGDTDYMVITTGLNQALAHIEKGIVEGKPSEVEHGAAEIRHYLNSAVDDYRRWDEIGKLSSRLGRLTESERKRIVEAQQTITVQEMYMLQQELLANIRDAAAAAANYVWNRLDRLDSSVSIRNAFLRELQEYMGGKTIKPKLIEADVIDEEE